MNDRNIRKRFHRAVDTTLSGLEGDPLLAQRVLLQAQQKEEPKVKKKISVGLVIALALMLASVSALAAGLGLNLFELFGRSEKRWSIVAEKSVLETQAPVIVHHEGLGDAQAVITNAYYDGESLQVAYMVENGVSLYEWVPTDEERAELKEQLRPDVLKTELWSTGQRPLRLAIEQAEKNHEAVGFVVREIIPSSEMMANGMKIIAWMGEDQVLEDGTYYVLNDYGMQLPKELKQQEALELSLPLVQTVGYYWFTGKAWYGRVEGPNAVGALTATVRRDDSMQTQRYAGAGEINGVHVAVTAEVGFVTGTVTVSADQDMFVYGGQRNALHAWMIDLSNEKGEFLKKAGIQMAYSPQELTWVCRSTGALPENMTMLLYEYIENGPITLEDARAQGVTISLTAE